MSEHHALDLLSLLSLVAKTCFEILESAEKENEREREVIANLTELRKAKHEIPYITHLPETPIHVKMIENIFEQNLHNFSTLMHKFKHNRTADIQRFTRYGLLRLVKETRRILRSVFLNILVLLCILSKFSSFALLGSVKEPWQSELIETYNSIIRGELTREIIEKTFAKLMYMADVMFPFGDSRHPPLPVEYATPGSEERRSPGARSSWEQRSSSRIHEGLGR